MNVHLSLNIPTIMYKLIRCARNSFFNKLNNTAQCHAISYYWYNCKMASEKPGSIEQEQEQSLTELEQTLLSMENLDRASPEIWPEKYPGLRDFINSFAPPCSVNLPYSKELTQEDQNYLHQLAALPTAGLISKVKELHDIAYQLGVEESKEVTRGKYLNLFKPRSEKL